MVDKESCYKGKNNEEFISLIKKIINKEIKHTGDMGLKVASERSIEAVGQQLKGVYTKVLNDHNDK